MKKPVANRANRTRTGRIFSSTANERSGPSHRLHGRVHAVINESLERIETSRKRPSRSRSEPLQVFLTDYASTRPNVSENYSPATRALSA